MPDYFVFGGCLQSELELPELAEARDTAPTWTLRVGTLPPAGDGEMLSDLQPTHACRVQFTRHGARYRYTHSCSGAFEIDEHGRDIVFEPAPGGRLDVARTDLIARVLLHCVDQGRITWLHGSAVAVDSGALAFLGPSGAGKSTMALALARAGARHICDDTLPVEGGDPPVIRASDHTLRLCTDSRAHLAPDDPAIRRQSDGKYILTHAGLSAAAQDTGEGGKPLSALYLLERDDDHSAGAPGAPVVRRRLIPPRVALPMLMQHLKLGLIVRPGTPVLMLQRLGALSRTVPVYELRVTRDWTRIDELARQVIAWHDVAAAPAGAHLHRRAAV